MSAKVVFRVNNVVLALLAIVVAIAPARRAEAAYPQTLTTTTPFLNLPRPTNDPLWADAFAQWDKRQDTKSAQAALAAFENIAAKHPTQLEAHLWVMRAAYLLGFREKSKRDEYLRKAIAAGDKARAIDPKNEAVMYWHWSALAASRPLTEDELKEIQKFGSKYSGTRELVVPTDDPAWATAIKLWDGRWNRDNALKAISAFSELDKKYPNRIETKLWLARSNYWIHYISTDPKEKATWLLAAAKQAQAAQAMEPRNPAAAWWIAASLGQYASINGPMSMAKYAMEITRDLMIVFEEDPNYFYGGISQYLALAFARAGALTRKALEMTAVPAPIVERIVLFASAYEPRYLRNHTSLAELYISQGKIEEARAKLNYVLAANPKALPLMEPENLQAQGLAREMLAKMK